jgi:hypothetical protein
VAGPCDKSWMTSASNSQHMSERISQKTKRMVAERAHDCCEYCLSQARFSPQPFSVEHITPRQVQGSNEMTNLAFSCQGCNNLKYTKTEAIDPLSAAMVPLYHPRQHSWNDHFAWEDGYVFILGISAIGRATIALLQLNRPHVINLRKVLTAMNEHPPHLS